MFLLRRPSFCSPVPPRGAHCWGEAWSLESLDSGPSALQMRLQQVAARGLVPAPALARACAFIPSCLQQN